MDDVPSAGEPGAEETGPEAALMDRIQRFLDGEGDAQEHAAVERLLDSDPEAQRIEALLRQERDALRAFFQHAEAEVSIAAAAAARRAAEQPTPAPARPTPQRAAGWSLPTWLTGGLGLTLGAAMGALAVLFLSPPLTPPPAAPTAQTMPGWRLSAATYHRLYAPETFDTAPVAPEARLAGLDTVGSALGLDLASLAAPPPGFTLERAQLLNFNGKPLAQIAYSGPGGLALSLCIVLRADGGGEPAAPAASAILDIAAVDWRSDGHAFLLLGSGAPETLAPVAEAFAQSI